jgi:hypothetical protein
MKMKMEHVPKLGRQELLVKKKWSTSQNFGHAHQHNKNKIMKLFKTLEINFIIC